MVDLSVDLHRTYWSVAQAAEAAEVKPGVIRLWKHRRHLKPAAKDDRGRPLFLAVDAIKAEKATRQRARRKYVLR